MLAFAMLTLTNCQRLVPPPAANEIKFIPAQNITVTKGRIEGRFENDIWACIYTDGGASLAIPGKPQIEIGGNTFPDVDGSITCSNAETGDYLRIFQKTGSGKAKIAGKMYYLLPYKEKGISAR